MSDGSKLCDVCGLDPAVYASPLLGNDSAICRECFLLWYDGQITDGAEMKRIRQAVKQEREGDAVTREQFDSIMGAVQAILWDASLQVLDHDAAVRLVVGQLKKVLADETEACAKLADAIRARGTSQDRDSQRNPDGRPEGPGPEPGGQGAAA